MGEIMNIGEKIRRLRIKNNLTQKELADRTELSKGFISQVERDLTSPSIATLVDILECLGTNLKEFFDDMEDEKIVFGKDDVFVKTNNELGHEVVWLIPNSQKNHMEPIILNLEPGGSSEIDEPHEGEEFGYVISGSIYIYLGNQKLKAKRGESFYFKPSSTHYITNAGKSISRVLWISTPPNF